MNIFFKILKFVFPYKFILILATLFSIFFSLTNGITLYSVVPIFDSLTETGPAFHFSITAEDSILLQKNKPALFERLKILQIRAKQMLNSFFESKTKEEVLITVSIAIVPLVFIRGFFDFCARILFAFAGNKAVLNIRKEIFSHLIKLPYQFFQTKRSGEMVSKITRDVIPLTSAVSFEIYNLVSGIILLITNIIILSIVNWRMILFIIVLMPIIALPISYLGNQVKKYTTKLQEGYADISSHLQETFSGIKVIKSFGMEGYENERFKNINKKIFLRDIKRRIFQNLNPSIVEFIGAMAVIALFVYGGYQIINGLITSGEFIFTILIVINLFDPVKMISSAINGTKAGEAAAKRIYDIMNYPSENFEQGIDGSFERSINLYKIWFKYNNDYVLNDVNISIKKGETLAIVGASGSGKSTILDLICSLYDPTNGEILFDDFSIQEFSLYWKRKRIAVVTQDVFLFHGTVLENITCGENYNIESVIRAAKTSHAHEFILKLDEGYNTVVGERGVLLSGGERQRMSIARAVLADPEIILFDEATSALDSESEKLIKDSLDILFKDRTSIIVSHRLSTIEHADSIYLLSDGKVADKGSHNELFTRNEDYRRLFSV